MLREIFKHYRDKLPDFPSTRRPRVGSVIREIRTNRGLRQMDLADEVRINHSTFKSFENDHQKATTVDNLERCAKALNVTTDELILLGREYDPGNFFIMKRSDEIPEIEGIRKRKHTPEDWFQSIRLRLKDFDLTPISPPINSKKDFFVCRLVLPPKRTIENLLLGVHMPIISYIAEGFNIKVLCGDKKPYSLTSGQAYSLDGFFPHSIFNEDEDHSAIIYLITKLPNFDKLSRLKSGPACNPSPINISQGVDAIRSYRSERANKQMSLRHLADLTDTLNERQLIEIMRLKQGASVVYWEKIEDLLSATNVSMDEFLLWAQGLKDHPFSVANAKTRAWIEYIHHGLKIYACTPPGINNLFFCGQIFIEGAGQVSKDTWERKDKSMVALYVEEGEIQVFVGKRKKTISLSKGESAYLDGNLGYALRNASKTQAQVFFATHKAIQL